MPKEDKYYYNVPAPSFLNKGNHQPQVIKWNEDHLLEVNENVDFRQYISLTINKRKQRDIPKPVSTEFEKVRPVIKEIFLSHYNLAIKYIHESIIDQGEFYLYNRSKDWWQIAFYSKDEKNKTHIEIDFRDGIEDLWLMFICSPGHKGRPDYRKHATPITIDRFKQFLNLTIQYFHDSDSVQVLLEDYIKNFRLLCYGNERIEGLIISTAKAFEEILNQLDLRKLSIEKRLIENDSDSVLDRARLRGELDSLLYTIKTINSYK